MKKIISLIMVIAMLAAMSVVVWARYESCPDCEIALVSGSWTEDFVSATCPTCGNHNASEYYKCTGWRCPSCGIPQFYSSRVYVFFCSKCGR